MNTATSFARTDRDSIKDQVRRLFSVSSLDAETHRETALAYLRQFLESPNVSASCSLDDIRREIDAASHDSQPIVFSEYLKFLTETIIPQSSNMTSPRCMGHMTSVVPGFVWALGDLIVGLNQNLVKRDASRALTLLEKNTLATLHKAVYGRSNEFYAVLAQSDSNTLGIMTSGATISNISGLWIARNLAFAPSAGFAGIEEEGIAPALAYSHVRKAVIICSRFAHYSIQKAAAMLGLGEGSVIMAPVDCNGRMDITALRRIVDDCGIRGFRVVAIVATAGTTDCGSIDPLEEIGEIAADARIHFHVDAAWGAPLIFSQRYCARLTGIDRADSITIDAHKQFYLPIGSSVLLLRDPRAASVIEKQTSYMLQEGSGDLGKRSLEGSRPGSALLLHAALNIIGPRGYGWLIEDNIQKAKVMCRKLLALGDFELLIPPETNIVLYRYVPHDMKIAARNRTLAASDNQFLNKLNEKIQRTQNKSGRAFVSRTTIENVYEGCPVTALRAVLGNPFTTEADIDFILEDQIRIAGRVLQESRDGN